MSLIIFPFLFLFLFLLSCCRFGSVVAKKQYVRAPSQGRFWVITDIHYDDGYTPGTEADCGQPLCCRNATNGPGPIKDPAPKWGTLKCDAPELLVRSILQSMADVEPNPDFVVWLGDNVKHDIMNQSKTQNLEATKNCTMFIQNAFPNVSIIPIFGNHESYPTDQFSLPPGMAWLYDPYWKDWIPKDSLSTFLYGGYYRTVTAGGLLVVALNLMYCDPLNFEVQNYTTTDPANQLAWLVSVLTQARVNKQPVLVISHIPPGMDLQAGLPNCLPGYSTNFSNVVANFSDVIVAQLYGHTHKVNFGLVNPSLTPYIGHNPGVRLITYDLTSKEFQNIYTYWTNLSATNEQDKLVFEQEYELPSDYDMVDLTPKSWLSLGDRMRKDDELFDLWYSHYYTMDTNQSCGFTCKRLILCAMENVGDTSAYSLCLLTP